jgi:D-threo-aldose 1-dehydrogenase
MRCFPIGVRKNISVVIGSPYNTGILHDPKPESTFDFVEAPGDLIEKAMRLKAACSRYDIPLPAEAIQFPFAHPAVARVLTGARSAIELRENLRLMQVKISVELWRDLRNEGLVDPRAPLPSPS